jgi:putative spermidine/putrescine transport system substrate-binding protein/spermidine/putrescine transport system substrate-binding protein
LCWGTINFTYNADFFKGKDPPTSYWDMWDPKYKGKVLASEDAGINITTVAILLGYDGYNLTDAQMEEVKQKLLEVKPNIRSLYTGLADAANFFATGEAWLGMSQASVVTKWANDAGANMVDLFPKGSLVWVDSWAITKGGQEKREICEKWIDYSISLDVQETMIIKTYYGGVNKDLVDVLDAEVLKVTHLDDFGIFERLTLMANPESWEKRLKLWNEVKATKVD